MNSQKRLNTPEEEAKRLKISVKTLAKWRSTGHPKLPFIKIGGAVRYDPDQTDAYLANYNLDNGSTK